MRKTTFLLLMITALFLVSCKENIELDIAEEVTVTLNEPHKLVYETNDTKGLNFESLDESMLTVSDEGVVTGLKEGRVNIKVSSKTDSSKVIFVTIFIEDDLSSTSFIDVESSITLNVKDDYTLDVITNIDEGVSFTSLNENIVTVTNNGLVKGVNPGTTKIKVTSNENEEIYEEVNIEVLQLDILLEAWVDVEETYQLSDEIITNASYTSSDTNVATVDESGLVKGINPGITEITIKNKNDENIYEVFTLYVKGVPEDFTVTLKEEMLVNEEQKLELEMEPVYGDKEAIYQSYNPSILKIDSSGNIKAISPGNSSIQVTLIANPEISKRFYISVVSYLAVDVTKSENDQVEDFGYTFEYGKTLFNSIGEALDNSVDGSIITVYQGTYNEDLNIKKGVTLQTKKNVNLNGNIKISSSDVSIEGFTFNNTQITNDKLISNLKIANNVLNDFNKDKTFIDLVEVSGLIIAYNEIEVANNKAISIKGFSSGANIIKGNIIKGSHTAIVIKNTEDYDSETSLEIMWNKISDVDVALDIDLGNGSNSQEIRQVIRFNEIENYETALTTNIGNNLDLNLNYWGNEGPKIAKFENVTLESLDGFYSKKEEVISEDEYDPRDPVKIAITNKKDEIDVGEEYKIEFKIFPRELSDDTVTWRYSNLPALEVDGATIKGLYTWDVTITLRARSNPNVFDSFLLQITSDPYIEIVSEELEYTLEVGDSFKLNTNVVPYQIRDEKVIYESLNEDIATVTNFGDVNLIAPGTVTILAKLESDQNVYQEFTFRVFAELDLADPFDFARSTMVMASQLKSFNVYGVTFDYQANFLDSVSRLLIEEIEIDQSMMIPEIYPQIRPGLTRLKPNLPEDEIYNDEYVQYVVVHETANTNENGGALFHAQYLMNEYNNQTTEFKSWHFTVDDKEIYQHIPTDEVAYHAGDGSSVAGSPWSDGSKGGIGGGNRNGIGIETSVAIGDDIMSIWHRVARLASKLSKEYNLPKEQPRENVKFHKDFSGKWCPQSMLRASYDNFFYSLVEKEYVREFDFPGLKLQINSNNLEYLTNDGRIIKRPEKALTVSYDLTILYNETSITETFYIYLPGQLK